MKLTWKKPGAVVVCSREQAQRYLNATGTKRDVECVVSLGATRPHGLDKVKRKLVLTFEDYEREPTADEIACGLKFIPPTFDDVCQIKAFLENYGPWFSLTADLRWAFKSDSYTRVLIHCEQGIARSTAAALIGFAMFYKDAQTAIEMLVEHCEETPNPNKLMVKYADDLLDFRGGLIRAVDNMWGKTPGGIIVPRFTE